MSFLQINPEISNFKYNFSVTHCHYYFCSIQNQTWVIVCSLGIYSNILTIRFFRKVLWTTAVYSKQIIATMMSYVIINLFWQQFIWQQLIFFYLLFSHYCNDLKNCSKNHHVHICISQGVIDSYRSYFFKLVALLHSSHFLLRVVKKILFSKIYI